LPGTPEQNLELLWKDILEIYDDLHTENRYGSMRMTMFTTKSQPQMKGKAAEIKDLGPVMVRLWRKYCNPEGEINRKILSILEGSCHLDDILAKHVEDVVLPDAAANDLIGTCFIMFATWYQVWQHFKGLDMPLFGMTGKAHALLHACLLSKLGLSL